MLYVRVLFAQSIEALAQLDENRVVEVSSDAGGNLLLDLLRRHVRALSGHQVLDCLRVENDGLGALGDLNFDVLVDQLDGLGAEGVPDEPAGDVRWPDRFVDVGEPLVVIAECREHRIGAERLPQLGDHAVGEPESVLGGVVRDGSLRPYQPFVAADGQIDPRKECDRSGHRWGELFLQLLDVADHGLHRRVVEGE